MCTAHKHKGGARQPGSMGKLGSTVGQDHVAPFCCEKHLRYQSLVPHQEKAYGEKRQRRALRHSGGGDGGLSVIIQPRNDAHDDGFPGH